MNGTSSVKSEVSIGNGEKPNGTTNGVKHTATNGFKSYATTDSLLPASWYSAEPFYELEKRAIFSKEWLMISHELRFKEVGDFVNFEMAGYKFFVIRDRKMELRAFLNVCRHRAYPIVEKESGKAGILACKYHGWSYGLSGNLAKAPRFENVDDFDRSKYSLFGVHLRVDRLGFIWVNLDAAETPTIPWGEHMGGVDEQPRLGDFTMDDFVFDHTWEADGAYNWKAFVDNYNECYHCTTAHPGIVATTNLETYDVVGNKGWIEHYSRPLEEIDSKYGVVPTYLFPNSSILISDKITYVSRFTPTSATTVKMQYEFYRHKSVSDEDFKTMDPFFKQIEIEDIALCNAVQKNLNSDTYISGPLHPHNEKGVIYAKGLMKEVLQKHLAEEQKLGRKISPARREEDLKEVAAEDAFCRFVCDQAGPKAPLEW